MAKKEEIKISSKADITRDTPLKEILKLAPACKCSACSHGCKYSSGFLANGDAEKIAKLLGVSAEQLKKDYLEEVEIFHTKLQRPKLLRKNSMPYGKCVFYDEKIGCKIHKVKPLQCRTSMGCGDYGEQLTLWFMHNYALNEKDPQSMKEYGIYIKSGGKTLK